MVFLNMFVENHLPALVIVTLMILGYPGRFDVFGAEFDFVTDAYPSRESYSVYGQTSYSVSTPLGLISVIRH